MMFNIVNGTAPTYMSGMVTSILPIFQVGVISVRPRRDVPRTRTVFGSRAFSVAGPVAWNGLPSDVRTIHDVIAFKSALKKSTHACAIVN